MSIPSHLDIVQHAWNVQPPAATIAGALDFLLRLIDVLPAGERAGLLLKPAGENIVDYRGKMVSAGRICYPNGEIVKVLTDVPTTNGPQWAPDAEPVDVERYLDIHAKSVDSYEGLGGDPVWDAFGLTIFADYAAAGQGPDSQMFRWAGRTIFDVVKNGLSVQASIDRHRAEWLAILKQ